MGFEAQSHRWRYNEPFYFRLSHVWYTQLYYIRNHLPWCRTMRHTRVTMRSLLAMLIVQSSLFQLLLWFAVLSCLYQLFLWFIVQSFYQLVQSYKLFCQILYLWLPKSQPAFIYHHSHSVWSLVTLGQPCITSLLAASVSRLGSLPRPHHRLVILADPVKLTLGKSDQTLSNSVCQNVFQLTVPDV